MVINCIRVLISSYYGIPLMHEDVYEIYMYLLLYFFDLAHLYILYLTAKSEKTDGIVDSEKDS